VFLGGSATPIQGDRVPWALFPSLKTGTSYIAYTVDRAYVLAKIFVTMLTRDLFVETLAASALGSARSHLLNDRRQDKTRWKPLLMDVHLSRRNFAAVD